jgi:hypothetical protein
MAERQFETATGTHCELLVVDVVGLRDDALGRLFSAARHANFTIVVYSELTPLTVHRVIDSIGDCVSDLIILGVSDGPILLRKRLARPILTNVSVSVLAGLANQIAILPRQLLARVVGMIAGGHIADSVTELAIESDVSVRSLDRWVRRAGIHSATRLLAAARILRLRGIADRGLEHPDAIRACYQSYETARRQCANVLRVSPGSALKCDRRQVVERVLEYLSDDL